MVYVIDFGSQTTHLIARRITELGAIAKIISPEDSIRQILNDKPKGIIFSGGPAGVYEKNSPTVDRQIFSLNIPILGICYGFQLIAHLNGGKVIPGKKEYGPAKVKLKNKSTRYKFVQDLPDCFTVWMSHGDEVKRLPDGFEIIGESEHLPFAIVGNHKNLIYGLQFHPEVEHTEKGSQILENFLKICGVKVSKQRLDLQKIEQVIKEAVKDKLVIGAVSGGVDSTVAAVLTARAIGNKFIPIYVENGLMREGTDKHVRNIFSKLPVKPIITDVRSEMLKRLKGVTDPEEKRKIIGQFYIEVFEREMEKLLKGKRDVGFLLQGTIYSDVIESGAPRRPGEQKDKGTKRAAKIKSHHNVGGLPKNMKLKLLEPLREFYKDEVRKIGKELSLNDEFIYKQPFPGPGFAIRIMGEITKTRLQKARQADKIVLEELEKAEILPNVFLSFPVLTGAFSTAVKGDHRFWGEVIALRVIESQDVMTARWTKLPYGVLQKISSRIVNEVPGISRVVYDITTKPPATMEWE